jgi:uncharacterized protein YjaG (DUF416 family)
MPKRRFDAKEINETFDEIVKAMNIQKAKVDQNKMLEEMQEDIEKFHKPVLKEVNYIVPAIDAIEASDMKMIKDITPPIPQLVSAR